MNSMNMVFDFWICNNFPWCDFYWLDIVVNRSVLFMFMYLVNKMFYQELVLHGRRGFYEGRIAQAVVDIVQENGGVMSLSDMKNHVTTEISPIYIDYKVG